VNDKHVEFMLSVCAFGFSGRSDAVSLFKLQHVTSTNNSNNYDND